MGITESFVSSGDSFEESKTDFSSGWTISQSQWLYMKTILYFYTVWRSMICKLLAGKYFFTFFNLPLDSDSCFLYIFLILFWGCHTCIQQNSIIHPSLPYTTATALISQKDVLPSSCLLLLFHYPLCYSCLYVHVWRVVLWSIGDLPVTTSFIKSDSLSPSNNLLPIVFQWGAGPEDEALCWDLGCFDLL